MRYDLTRDRLRILMAEIAKSAPRRGSFRVYLVGGGTAVLAGWRPSSVDADFFFPDEEVARDIQEIKEKLNLNVEFARPEDFVPALRGSEERHVFVEEIGNVAFYHYDPYAQLLSKVVRGFRRDLDDARCFVESGFVDLARFRALVQEIPKSAYAKYPALSSSAVVEKVELFCAERT